MPPARQAQVRGALQTVAGIADLSGSPNLRPMSGDWAGCHRLRIGSYRAILRIIPPELPEAPEGVIEVLALGPRGDIYK